MSRVASHRGAASGGSSHVRRETRRPRRSVLLGTDPSRDAVVLHGERVVRTLAAEEVRAAKRCGGSLVLIGLKACDAERAA